MCSQTKLEMKLEKGFTNNNKRSIQIPLCYADLPSRGYNNIRNRYVVSRVGIFFFVACA